MVTGYQKALELLKTPQLTSSPFLQAGGRIVEDARMNALLVDSFALKDGIDHRRLRQVVSAMFAPPVIRRLADRVDRIAEDLLRGVTPHSGRIDMVETLGRRLPILVNCTMLGLSVVKEKKVRNWTDAIIAMMRREQFSGSDVEGLLDFLASLRAGSDGPWLSPLIDSLRRGAISDVEFDASVLLLMVSGYSTATSAIGSTLARYLSDPRARDLLDSGRCTAESFAYEAVRLATSVLTLARRVKKVDETPAWTLDLRDRSICGAEPWQKAFLTNSERALLLALAQAPSHMLETDMICELLSQRSGTSDMGKRALESLVSRLRKKLESLSGHDAEPALKAVWGIGYQLCVPVIVKA